MPCVNKQTQKAIRKAIAKLFALDAITQKKTKVIAKLSVFDANAKKIMTIAKLFMLHLNAVTFFVCYWDQKSCFS